MEYLTIWTRVAFVVLLISYGGCHSSSDGSSFRGPHHPRGESTHQEHQHYVPSSDSDHHHNNVKLTHDKQLLHDKEHLKEDLGEWVFMDGKEPTPEEMEFHYFKTHDYDNNSKLDGLEILQAISHILPMTQVEYDLTKDASPPTSDPSQQTSDASHSHGHAHHHQQQPQIQLTDSQKAEIKRQRDEDFQYYVELIDRVFSEDDLDRDGYLSYMEYSIGRRREEEAAKAAAATLGAKH